MSDERFLIRATNDRDEVMFYEKAGEHPYWTSRGYSVTKMSAAAATALVDAFAEGTWFSREALSGLSGNITFDVVERVYLASHSKTVHFDLLPENA